MGKHSSLKRLVLATVLALALLLVLAQSALARVVWCDYDLGPMATKAEDQNAGTPAGAIQSGTEADAPEQAVSVVWGLHGDLPGDGHVVKVPVQTVSTEKGGANPNK